MSKRGSFIRWAGGKSWFVPAVQNMIKNIKFNNYIEPFMGGASVFFALDLPQKAFLSDINGELVNAFIQIRDNSDKVIKILKDYKADETSYYKIREQEPVCEIEQAARFIYLNFYSFNGIYRVNSKGKFNVPYGKRSGEINFEKLMEIKDKLQNVEISCRDFDLCKTNIQEGDLVFLDPPYTVSNKATDNEHFIAYNATLFSLEDQERLAALIDYIQSVNAYFILTNAHHPEIARIFAGKGKMLEFDRACVIGGRAAKRGKVKEYIFTNIPGINCEEAEG